MTKHTKQDAYTKYLSGCTFLGMAPEFEYKERTQKQIDVATEELRSRARSAKRKEVVDSASQNAKQLANFVQQKAGESRKSVMDRAKALKAKVPFTVSIRWGN